MTLAPRTLDEAELFDWLRLSRSDNVGPRTFQILLSRYGTARAAIAAVPALVRAGAARPIALAAIDEVERERDAIRKAALTLLPSCDPAFPDLLRAIDSAPPLLLVKGRLDVLKRPCVGIVGSRNASAIGLAITDRLARGLGEGGVVVVSGLARGIDARAHLASLESGTIGVLAGGHDRIYPSEHRGLVDRIAETGAVVSELPIAWEPRGRDFPRRNRIVSGLSHAVVVVEAALRSGSLITARFAAEQNRTVFAVPGSPMDPRAEGTNDLIRGGAILCAKAEHILDDLGAMMRTSTLPFALREDPSETGLWVESDVLDQPAAPHTGAATSPVPAWLAGDEAGDHPDGDAAQVVLDLIGSSPVTLDELIRAAGLTAGAVHAIVTDLEFDGVLIRHGANAVSRSPPKQT